MSNLNKPLKRILENDLFLPSLIIVSIAAIAYLPFISQLGYYYMDIWRI
jgi:hypothetical protein